MEIIIVALAWIFNILALGLSYILFRGSFDSVVVVYIGALLLLTLASLALLYPLWRISRPVFITSAILIAPSIAVIVYILIVFSKI